jgi:serine/threonine-protein kinase
MMARSTPTGGLESPEAGPRQVDVLCDRFEEAWRAGQHPRIESYLDRAEEPRRPLLLRELIALEVELRRGFGEQPTPQEYYNRFPGQEDTVDNALAEPARPGQQRAARPSRALEDVGSNLLFGLLAFQNNFIDRTALLAAFSAWVADRSRSLGRILLDSGALSPSRHELIEALVGEHLMLHGNDPERSLAALGSIRLVRDDLSRLAGPELQASLMHVAVERDDRDDPDRTSSLPPLGTLTSAGTRFQILRPHARGGLGEIFVAHDCELNREVALKGIQDQLADDPHYRARFEFEAEVTGGLEHPGVVPIYGLGHTPTGRPFYAMRLVKGKSLREVIGAFHEAESRPGRDPASSALELRELLGRFIDVCDAVGYAHSRGVIHRDLKPGNIMVGRYGETLVVDWGTAKAAGRRDIVSDVDEATLRPLSGWATPPTMDGATIGTPAYMSPEQAAGRIAELGASSDVYSLGATLYCLLAGRAPFEGPDPVDILPKVEAGKWPRPRQMNSRIPIALEAICLKAMAMEPANRYASARALGEDVARWLADQPVLAYPEPFPTRAMRWVRRHKPWVAAAAGLVLLATAGLAVHDWQIGKEKDKTAEQLSMTRKGLRDLLQVAGEELADIRSTEPLRQKLAEMVLGQYQDLEKKYPRDGDIRLEKAHVYRVISGIERLTGQFAKSDEACNQAVRLLAVLSEADPGRLEYHRWLAEALLERGSLYHANGMTSKAKEYFNAAIARTQFLLVGPMPIGYRRARGSALINLSEILVQEKRLTESRTRAGEAVELLKPIGVGPQTSKQASRDRWLLCQALVARGVASLEAGDFTIALDDLAEAEQVAKQVAKKEDPFYDDMVFQLACIDHHRGKLGQRTMPPLYDPALALERALQALTGLASKYERTPYYKRELAATLTTRAALRLSHRRLNDAQADCQAAIGLLERLIEEQKRLAPENPRYLSLLGQASELQGRILTAQGRLAEGRKLREKGAAALRHALELDEARALDQQLLNQIRAELQRDAEPAGKSN